MTARRNPFEYMGANDLPSEMVLDYYIEDFNYSRFIRSKRNLFLVGERGSGKSMALIYNSLKIQLMKAEHERIEPELNLVGIYVPCNTPLTYKKEFQLLNEFNASVISEHFLVLSMAYAFTEALRDIPGVYDGANQEDIRNEIKFLLGFELPPNRPFFEVLKLFVQKELFKTQREINSIDSVSVKYENTYGFSSLIIPLVGIMSYFPKLANSHCMFLIDDAHDLNEHQIKSLNSWIAYRDHSKFSFKVAIAKVGSFSLKTSSGGNILEGHDFTRLDMVQPFQNELSDFGRLADKMVRKRLVKFGYDVEPEKYFPSSELFLQDLEKAENVVRLEAIRKYGDDKKKISDFVYKYKRAQYFRSRPPHANRPVYSGFDTIVYLSTGVVRNLLQPCYWMYDKVLSLNDDDKKGPIDFIPSNIQSECIIERSRALWDYLRNGLPQNIEGCSSEEAKRAYQLMDNLAVLFRKRLLKHESEPRANSFTISAQSDAVMGKLSEILRILQEAQILYMRSGSAKDKGRRESYYVPNRMLWPERGLDPHGQHARVSIKATDLWEAASDNKEIPFAEKDENTEVSIVQGVLFDAK